MPACLLENVSPQLETLWIVIGFVGQGIFGARMVVQWITSERAGRSVVPIAFWYMSIAGAVITLAYAIYRLDPVFIVSQAGGLLIYIRNLALLRLDRAQ